MTDLRYVRNLGALTEDEQSLLADSRVFIAGAGGLGGYLFSYLLRLGVGQITIADGDAFESTNLNRQLLSSQEVLGQSKAETAAAYAKAVNPTVKTEICPSFITEKNCKNLIAVHHLVLDGLDNIESRYILAEACDTLGIPYVYGAICGWNAQIGFFPAGTAYQRMKLLYPSVHPLNNRSCLSFVPALCASYQTAEAVKYLVHKTPAFTNSLLYLDLLEHETEEIPFSLN